MHTDTLQVVIWECRRNMITDTRTKWHNLLVQQVQNIVSTPEVMIHSQDQITHIIQQWQLAIHDRLVVPVKLINAVHRCILNDLVELPFVQVSPGFLSLLDLSLHRVIRSFCNRTHLPSKRHRLKDQGRQTQYMRLTSNKRTQQDTQIYVIMWTESERRWRFRVTNAADHREVVYVEQQRIWKASIQITWFPYLLIPISMFMLGRSSPSFSCRLNVISPDI